MKIFSSFTLFKMILVSLFTFIVALNLVKDYVEIFHCEYSFEIQTSRISSPKVYRYLNNTTSVFYFSENNDETEDDYESNYHNLTILARTDYKNYMNFVIYRRSVNSYFLHNEFSCYHEYSLPPPVV